MYYDRMDSFLAECSLEVVIPSTVGVWASVVGPLNVLTSNPGHAVFWAAVVLPGFNGETLLRIVDFSP